MKRFMASYMILLLMVSTIGVHVSIHYCGGEQMMLAVNGVRFQSSDIPMMKGCSENDGCPMCKTVKHSYRIHSQFSQGQQVIIQPTLVADDWFHGALPQLSDSKWLLPTKDPDERPAFFDSSPPLRHPCIPHSGRRGPPVLA